MSGEQTLAALSTEVCHADFVAVRCKREKQDTTRLASTEWADTGLALQMRGELPTN
jgi:hypothetical protein